MDFFFIKEFIAIGVLFYLVARHRKHLNDSVADNHQRQQRTSTNPCRACHELIGVTHCVHLIEGRAKRFFKVFYITRRFYTQKKTAQAVITWAITLSRVSE